jgi:DNA-binding IclR family transcriptional regulator
VRDTQPGVQSVGRALQILTAFESDSRELGVGQLAARLSVHKSTASRLVATLASHGFLERAPSGEAFRLGTRLARLGMRAAGADDVVDAARPAMEQLSAETGETVVLSVPLNGEAVDVAQIDSRYRVGGKTWTGRRTPLHATSDGKVFLAFGAATLEPGRLERVAEGTITSRAALEGELRDVREAGWARAVGECEEGLNGVAAPITGADGRCVAALSVSGPAYRLAPEGLAALAGRCTAAAAAISSSLRRSRDGN